MKSTVRFTLIGAVAGVALAVLSFALIPVGQRYWAAHADRPPVTDHVHEEPSEAVDHSDHAAPETPAHSIVISPGRLQSIGIRYEPASRRAMERNIRTVGRVEIDERRLAHVHMKISGWIEDLHVNTTGERVTEGQTLFTIYSPELLATQQEYLLALRARAAVSRSEYPDVIQRADALVDAARQRLRLWDIGDSDVERLERTGEVLRAMPIHSPISGTVLAKSALAGMFVELGQDLYTIADLSSVWLLADIYEYEIPFIRSGQIATVTVSYQSGLSLQGRIGFIYPTVDPETRTAQVRFELQNPGERLKPGMYANVDLRIPLGTRLAVPAGAILETGITQKIFIYHGEGRIEWRDAVVGVRAGDWVEVLEGVQADEQVITSATFLIDSESQLKSAVHGFMAH